MNEELPVDLTEISQGLLLAEVKIFTMRLGRFCLTIGSEIVTNTDGTTKVVPFQMPTFTTGC
ncbi:MAG: hypothetical protein P4L26_15370 [Terracidiphilus sp.]|nr:hypothetical protein [Terracidiphilus sp.]